MGTSHFTSYPVLDAQGKFAGILNVADLLGARVQSAEREVNRHRVLRVRWPFGRSPHQSSAN
jgi:CBS-domain-containing membrane protein